MPPVLTPASIEDLGGGSSGPGSVTTVELADGTVALVDLGFVPYIVSGTDVAVADGGTGASSASAARTNLGLVLGSDIYSKAAVDSGFQPLDSDLTAIAALTTTAYGRAFLALADAAAARTALGLGTAATSATTAFDAAGAAAAAQSASQPLDSDLTAIAALTTTSFGRSLLAAADAAALRTLAATDAAYLPVADRPKLGLPMPWTQDPGTLSGTALGLGSANRAIFQRVRGAGSISKIRMNIIASSGNISVAVYAGSGSGATAVPGTRLATSGSVASPGTGLREISLGATVDVDSSCWIGISADNTSVTFSHSNRANTTAIEAGLAGYQASAHPCPLSPSITQADGSIDTGIVLLGVP